VAARYILIIMLRIYFNFFFVLAGEDNKRKKMLKTQTILTFFLAFSRIFYLFIKIGTEISLSFMVPADFSDSFSGNVICVFEIKSVLNNKQYVNAFCRWIYYTYKIVFEKAGSTVRNFSFFQQLYFLLYFFLYRKLIKVLPYLKWFYCGAGIFLLLAVLFFGNETYGAKLSIDFGFFSLQPLEFVKILYVLFLTSFLQKSTEIKNLIISAVLAAVHVLLLVLSRDLGSAFILFMVYLFILFTSTGKWQLFLGGILLGSGASVVAYYLFSHVRVRVQAWLNPWPLIDNQGYQENSVALCNWKAWMAWNGTL
jgi:hypothetical protein